MRGKGGEFLKKYGELIGGIAVFMIAAVYFWMAFGIKQFNAGQPGIITSDIMPKIYGAAVMLLFCFKLVQIILDLVMKNRAYVLE